MLSNNRRMKLVSLLAMGGMMLQFGGCLGALPGNIWKGFGYELGAIPGRIFYDAVLADLVGGLIPDNGNTTE